MCIERRAHSQLRREAREADARPSTGSQASHSTGFADRARQSLAALGMTVADRLLSRRDSSPCTALLSPLRAARSSRAVAPAPPASWRRRCRPKRSAGQSVAVMPHHPGRRRSRAPVRHPLRSLSRPPHDAPLGRLAHRRRVRRPRARGALGASARAAEGRAARAGHRRRSRPDGPGGAALAQDEGHSRSAPLLAPEPDGGGRAAGS